MDTEVAGVRGVADATPTAGEELANGSTYEGNVDISTSLRIEGWARRSAPEPSQCYVSIICQGRLLSRVVADVFRPDLAERGMGHGCWGFVVDLTGKAVFPDMVLECILDDGAGTLYLPPRSQSPSTSAERLDAHGPRIVDAISTYIDQHLDVLVVLEPPQAPRGETVELLSDGLVLQAKTAPAGLNSEAVWEVRFGVPCSLRTAQGNLAVRMAGATFPVRPRSEQDTAKQDLAALQPLAHADNVVGNLDGVVSASNGTLLLKGWARDTSNPGRPVFVDVSVNGALVGHALADVPRPDVAAALGGASRCGFSVEIPDNLRMGGLACVEVRARAEISKIAGSGMSLPFGAQGQLIGPLPRLTALKERPAGEERRTGAVAAVVLNQDGAHLLEALFSSISTHEAGVFSRIVLVDHASTDDSVDIANKYKNGLPIQIVSGDRAASFSQSNNAAVAMCDEEFIAFINNDIVFTGPIINRLIDAAASDVGAVGAKLYDSPGERASSYTTQHLGIHFSPRAGNGICAIETRAFDGEMDYATATINVPAVTAALMVMRRKVFESLGGFDEGYFYGQEDVDLCLKALEAGLRNICVNEVSAVHMRGYSRRRMAPSLIHRRAGNAAKANASWGYALRRSFASLRQRPYLTGRALTVGIVVSEVGAAATAGDYMTGLELGLAISGRHNAQARLMTPADADARGFDIIVSMLDGFDVRTITNLNSSTVLVAWARNWFNRWASRPWRERFSLWFASSGLAVDYLSEELGRHVGLLPIATNPQRFATPTEAGVRDLDLVFTGSYWRSPREIIDIIRETQLSPVVYGANWEDVPEVASLTRGAVAYDRIPEIYGDTKIVVDDANSATKSWGSMNSRVFDAVAAGALPITNNEIGSRELFGMQLPVYGNAGEFAHIVRRYTTDEAGRLDLVEKLRSVVVEKHTYDRRATELFEFLDARSQSGFRIAIKIGAPKLSKADPWGDYHFALSLRRELEEIGHNVRIDCLEDWYGAHAEADDAVIVLRGLGSYNPSASQINLIWVISHPHEVTVAELDRYDRVFVASSDFVDVLARQGVVAKFLPQATDTRRFFPAASSEPKADYVFVGNSRGVSRPVVAYAQALGERFHLYGGGWSGLTSHPVRSRLVENSRLADLYRSAGAVLNDHWSDMRTGGFVSNRIFDAIACGVPVISDEVSGLRQIFGSSVLTYSDADSFKKAVQWLDANREEAVENALTAAARVSAHHGFDKRAEVFDAVVREEDGRRARLKRLPSLLKRHGE